MSRKITGGIRLEKLFRTRNIPLMEGVWLDCYSNLYNESVCGCITTRISDGNNYFITELKDEEINANKPNA